MSTSIRLRIRWLLTHLISCRVMVRILVVLVLANIVTTWPIRSYASKEKPQSKKAPEAAFEIINSKDLHYNYGNLSGSEKKDRIQVGVRNLTNNVLGLTGNVHIKEVVDVEGRPIELFFRMGELENSDEFVTKDSVEIGSGNQAVLAFELLPISFTPKPGSYKGDIKLRSLPSTTFLPVNISLTVYRSNLDNIDIGIASHFDYLDLVSTGIQSLLTATVHNKGNAALSIHAALIGQKDILGSDGIPDSLTFQRVVLNERGESSCSDGQSETIDPNDTITLYFKLQKSDITPTPGKYSAFLVVTSDDDPRREFPLTIYVPSKYSVEQTTILKAIKAWLLQWPKQWSLWYVGRNLDLDPILWDIVFWIFFAFFFYVIIRKLCYRIKLFFRRNRLGTIELENKLVNATTDQNFKIEGLEALLKDTLENLGLETPRPQPVIPISTEVGSLITKSGIAGEGVLEDFKKAVIFVWGIISPPIGHKMNITLRGGQNSYEAIVEIKNALTGRSEEIIAGLIAGSADDAVRKAAYSMYLHEINQKHNLKRTPKWARFTTQKGFEHYQIGKEKQGSKAGADLDAAVDAYKTAAVLEVCNALIRISLGSAHEEKKEFLDAMEVYLHVVTRWPEMVEPRYRLAVALSYHKEISEKWNKLEGKKREVLKQQLVKEIDRLKKYEQNNKLVGLVPDSLDLSNPTEKTFLDLALCQWKYLDEELKWLNCFRSWLRVLNPYDTRREIRYYLWAFVQPWGMTRSQNKSAMKVAQYCTEIQKGSGPVDIALKDIEKFIQQQKISMTWIVHYNAACAYSIALAKMDNSEWKKNGVEHLKEVILDPKSASSHRWLFYDDPDLDKLRGTAEFMAWKDELELTPIAASPKVQQQPPDSLAQGWELLAAGANVRSQRWEEHKKDVRLWPTRLDVKHLAEIDRWYQCETNIWTSVAVLAAVHGDSIKHNTFWDELMKDMAPMGKKPSLPVLSNKADSSKEMSYMRRWHHLADRAKRLQKKWERAEDKITMAISNRKEVQPIELIISNIDAAIEAWAALELWARKPMEKGAQDNFMKARGL